MPLMHRKKQSQCLAYTNTTICNYCSLLVKYPPCILCAVPLYVSAQAIGSHSINVTWSVAEEDAEGVIHYEVQWSLLAADKDDNITTTTMTIQQEGNASSVLITDLLPAMEYSIQVRALATAGWGQWSHQVRARTGPAGMQQHAHIIICSMRTSTTVHLLLQYQVMSLISL